MLRSIGVILIAIVMSVCCVAQSPLNLSSQQGTAGSRPEKLDKNEYAVVGHIYNEELSALGGEAIYPVCVVASSQTVDINRLARFLRAADFPISNYRVCVPRNGPFNGNRDYPHGMALDISEVRHSNEGVQVTVTVVDLTMHFDSEFTTSLRKGTYHFTQDKEGEWHVASYTKIYDFRDPIQPRPADSICE